MTTPVALRLLEQDEREAQQVASAASSTATTTTTTSNTEAATSAITEHWINPFVSMPRTVLIMGATGHQGSATVMQLCALPNSANQLKIYAVTRNPDSAAADRLKEKYPQIELIRGDYTDLAALMDSLPATPDALFSVQPGPGRGYRPEVEVQQGKALHEAAIDIGVRQIVYSSVDRGGSEASDGRPTGVPHFDSKREIEEHLVAECARSRSQTTWTILRPTTFFDMFTPDMQGRVVAATFGRATRGQQFVACRDIGWFAARALTEPAQWAGRKMSLAGEHLTLPQMRSRFYEKMGYAMPEAYSFFGSAALWGMKDLGSMYRWLDAVGYGADIDQCRVEHPKLMKFSEWIVQDSGFNRGGEVLGSWLQ